MLVQTLRSTQEKKKSLIIGLFCFISKWEWMWLRWHMAYVDARLWFGPLLPWLQWSDKMQGCGLVFFGGFVCLAFCFVLFLLSPTVPKRQVSSALGLELALSLQQVHCSQTLWAVSYFWKPKIRNVPPVSRRVVSIESYHIHGNKKKKKQQTRTVLVCNIV